MRVLVCGAQDFHDHEFLCGVLDEFHSKTAITCIIHGSGGGADALAVRWARAHGVYAMGFKADWGKYGKSAGPIRNDRMVTVGQIS